MTRFIVRFAFLSALGILPACTNATPPPGALMAQAAYPTVGSSWVMRGTGSVRNPSEDYHFTAVSATYRGAPVYEIQYGNYIDVLNPQTFNLIANLADGRETLAYSPDDGRFSWPLWVGKSWSVTATGESAQRITQLGYYRRVTAYEDVTVPAGTFKAFRIETLPGMGVDSAYRLTLWYAPSVSYVVKSVSSTSSSAQIGAGTITTEMVSPPQP